MVLNQTDIMAALERDGFAMLPSALTLEETASLTDAIEQLRAATTSDFAPGMRRLLRDSPAMKTFAKGGTAATASIHSQ